MAELLAEDLLDAVYRSALDPGAWNDVIGLMRRPFPSTVQAFYFLHLQPRRVEPVCVAGLETKWLRSFDALYFAPDNPWMRVSKSLHRPGVVRTTERLESFLGDPGVLYRSTYYHEWMKPQGFKHNIGNTLLSEQGLIANITLFRSPDMATFDDAEVRAFELLSKHMTRALQISSRLQPGLGSAASAALDAVPHALAVLDAQRRLLYANPGMEALLRRGHGLMLRDASLRAIDERGEVALTALLSEAEAPDRGAARSFGPLMLQCPGRPRLILRAVPVAGGSALRLPSRAATLLLASPCRSRELLSHEELRQSYGCTRAEARLVQCLLDGRGLRDAAAVLGVTYGTARAYLKVVFQKTGVHTQAQLVAKLLGDAATRPVGADTRY